MHNVRIEARPQDYIFPGEVVWAATAPDQPVDSKLLISLEPLTRRQFMGESTNALLTIPGEFSFSSLLMDDYTLHIYSVPEGMYLKDIILRWS